MAKFQSNEAYDALLKIGVATGAVDPIEEIQVAAREGNVARLRQLLEAHPDVNLNQNGTKGALQRPPLTLAAMSESTEAVRLLVERGADPNFREGKNSNALHIGAISKSPDMIKVLMELGASNDVPNKNDATPRDIVEGTWDDDETRTEIIGLLGG